VALSLLNVQITVATCAQITEFQLQQITEGEVQILSLRLLPGQRRILSCGQTIAVVITETLQHI
jgi:hypothetical protein